MRVVGFDPSLNNWGIAEGNVDVDSKAIHIENLSVITPVLPKGKQTRKNSKDISAATQLAKAVREAAQGADAVFVEVPHGSQSARAMASYGICVGILGSLQSYGISFFQLTEREVKLVTGMKKPSKKDMIDWAVERHPDAPWPYYARNGERLISESKAEHMADAIAAITAGLELEEFTRLLMINRTWK